MPGGLRFPPRPPGLVLGYHGCDRPVAEQVLAGAVRLEAQPKESDWLGDGVYFWQDDPQRALEWARDTKGHPDPFVIGAVLKLGYCLDLTSRACLDFIFDAYEVLQADLAAAGKPVPQNVGLNRKRDCLTINYALTLQRESEDPEHPRFDTVRGAFLEGDQLGQDPASGIWRKNHVEISVINPNCIKGLFRADLDQLVDMSHPPV